MFGLKLYYVPKSGINVSDGKAGKVERLWVKTILWTENRGSIFQMVNQDRLKVMDCFH